MMDQHMSIRLKNISTAAASIQRNTLNLQEGVDI